jgi:hypothetical protein
MSANNKRLKDTEVQNQLTTTKSTLKSFMNENSFLNNKRFDFPKTEL